ncbi:galectin-4 isoform X2 [Adelges cooleyi]|uniref:galectin-4 isoform X2 n=1 Tax=Adelges cooleyi TaxID=133065 RepID=UPI0021803ED0|nr:galectin-4 isoform X2 [Adelges cooleyi]
MAQVPFSNPPMPFIGPIQNGLRQGTVITVDGVSFPTTNRVCVNLQVGPNVAPRDAVALHVALDFSRNLIVRNSIQGQNWGVEESHGPPVSLIKGQPFKLDIFCDVSDYKIAYNGFHYTEMKHRMPFQSVYYLAIDGEAQLHNISIISGGNVGSASMPTPGVPTGFLPSGGGHNMPMPGQPGGMPMPGHPGGMPMPGHPGSMTGVPHGYKAYPGQTHHSSYLQKKAAKAQRKAAKKALKYGVPVAAGAGVGAYALHHKAHKHKGYKHKGDKHKGKKSSSSSSSSSSSD